MKKLLALLTLLAAATASAQRAGYWQIPLNINASQLPGLLPALSVGDGSGLTALNGTQVTTGTVAEARIASELTRTPVVNYDPAGYSLMRYYDGYVPSRKMTHRMMLTKKSTNYNEFSVHVPASISDTKKFARYYFSDRFNKTAGTGSIRLIEARESLLYSSTNLGRLDENFTTGTQGADPIQKIVHTNYTARSGTWTGPITSGLATNVFYCTNATDYVSYDVTITNDSTLAWYTYTHSTVGHSNVLVSITSGGSPIAGTNLFTVTNVNLRIGYIGLRRHELARGLPTGTYTVRIEAGPGADPSYRTYDGGIETYTPNLTNGGNYGTWYAFTNVFPTSESRGSSSRVYAFNGTKVNWSYQVLSVCGYAGVRVIDYLGNEIASGYSITNIDATTGWRYIDTYAASTGTTPTTRTIASGLTNGTYYMHVVPLPVKNASASNYRVFDAGAYAYNEGVTGVVGTDAFDDLQAQAATYFGAVYGDFDLGAGGNLEWAPQVRETSATNWPVADGGIITGVHGSEGALYSFWMQTNEVTLGTNYSGAAVDTVWVADRIRFGMSVPVSAGDSGTNYWAITTHTNSVSAAGYSSEISVDVIRSMDLGIDARWMVATLTTETYPGEPQSWGIGGGMKYIRLGNGERYDVPALLANTVFPVWSPSVAFESLDGNYVAISELLNAERHLANATNNGAHYVRHGAEASVKMYWTDNAYGTEHLKRVTSSDDWVQRARWRFLHAP